MKQPMTIVLATVMATGSGSAFAWDALNKDEIPKRSTGKEGPPHAGIDKKMAKRPMKKDGMVRNDMAKDARDKDGKPSDAMGKDRMAKDKLKK